MLRFALGRLLAAIPVALGVATMVFLLIRLTGDPIELMLGAEAPPEARDALRARLGLDLPLPVQYVSWLLSAIRGDLGNTLSSGERVSEVVMRHFGPTLLLTFVSFTAAILVGVALG